MAALKWRQGFSQNANAGFEGEQFSAQPMDLSKSVQDSGAGAGLDPNL